MATILFADCIQASNKILDSVEIGDGGFLVVDEQKVYTLFRNSQNDFTVENDYHKRPISMCEQIGESYAVLSPGVEIDDQNCSILNTNGSVIKSFAVGLGVSCMSINNSENIVVGYSDEGIDNMSFSNHPRAAPIKKFHLDGSRSGIVAPRMSDGNWISYVEALSVFDARVFASASPSCVIGVIEDGAMVIVKSATDGNIPNSIIISAKQSVLVFNYKSTNCVNILKKTGTSQVYNLKDRLTRKYIDIIRVKRCNSGLLVIGTEGIYVASL